MRDLTLDEKITLKGVFSKYGLHLPMLSMVDALHFWNQCLGYRPISWFNRRGYQMLSRAPVFTKTGKRITKKMR